MADNENISDAATATTAEPPVVLLSYSHDTKEHKAWVASLAQRLVHNGVQVLFDQWDLGPGDDVPKFMERSVTAAGRVLMICTEAYVRKADDGKGGVGYEAMVVTGELIRNLGTNKFIPVLRQSGEPKQLPVCVRTRLYVDLSDDAAFDENFELLLREIHNAPKLHKPALGINPYASADLANAAKIQRREERRLEFEADLETPESAYQRAHEIIRVDDRVAWRKLLLAARDRAATTFKQWYLTSPDIPPVEKDNWSNRYAHAQAGMECFAPLIACLVAAAETGKDGYADQLGWIDSILELDVPTTTTYLVFFPQLVVFVAHSLVGGMLMLSGAGEAAHSLATTKLAARFISSPAQPLFSTTGFTGWPQTLDHSCTVVWHFFERLLSSWCWLKTAFGDERECKAGVSGYYQLLSFLNFVALVKSKQLEAPEITFPVTVPLSFCVWPREVVEKGYTLFLRQKGILNEILRSNSLDQASFEAAWPKWIAQVGKWLYGVYVGRWPEMHVPQKDLPSDLQASRYVIK